MSVRLHQVQLQRTCQGSVLWAEVRGRRVGCGRAAAQYSPALGAPVLAAVAGITGSPLMRLLVRGACE